ncbi:MAG: hypothetical protein J2P21_26325 [Chloracidobacterium sp.]|nr:hypothetical protein [Chloracidobacterium sp.]
MKTIIVTLLVLYSAQGPNRAFGLLPIPGISSTYFSTQAPDAQKRADEIVASLNKKKVMVKEKYGVRREKYKEVRCEPVVKANPSEHSGTYEVSDLNLGYSLTIRVGDDGRVDAHGHEPTEGGIKEARQFVLRDARIEGALLTGEKVYTDGAVEKFEGVFIKRTVIDSPTDDGVSSFGLGVVERQKVIGGLTLDKLFYQRKE